MTKLPEPTVRLPHGKYIGEILMDTPHSSFYTTDQLQAYGDARANEALELAAQTCTNIAISPSNVVLGVAIKCVDAIRKLKEITE